MKTLRYINILLALFFLACNSTPTKNTEVEVSTYDWKKEESPLQKKYGHLIPKDFPKITDLDSFLQKPFDLQAFKKLKRGSNSSGGGSEAYYYKPDFKGIYYSFFLFSNSIGHRNGHITTSPEGFRIETYKPYGKYENDYLDPNEILIEVYGTHNDINLPELAFVGYDTIEIKQRLGKPTFKTIDHYVYSSGNFALILSVKSGRVDWFKYVHLKEPLTNATVNDDLYSEI